MISPTKMKPKCFYHPPPVNKDNAINLHGAMRYPLTIGKFFGFFPVNGINSRHLKSLRFSWYSFSTIYALATSLLVLFSTISQVYKLIAKGRGLDDISSLVFTLSGTVSCVLFIKLARDWPQLVRDWHQVETRLGNGEITTNLKRKLLILTLMFFAGAAIEHSLVQCYNFLYVSKCTTTATEAIKRYFVNVTLSHIFCVVDYAIWKGILFQLVHLQITFSWTFVNVFLILISTALALRLKQIASKVENLLRKRVSSLAVWRNLRDDHNRVCHLCLILDKKIEYLVLLSFFSNLYFTLVQLYGSLGEIKGLVNKIYFSWSFFFLIVRIICVCLFAASINEENNKILPLLLSTPSYLYNLEIKRFIGQVYEKKVIISGKKFFYITKGLILNIAGAIVTYELVLIQFKIDPNHNEDNPSTLPASWIC